VADLLCVVDEIEPRVSAALAFVFDSLGITAEYAPSVGRTDLPRLLYSAGATASLDEVSITRHPGDLLWRDLLEGRIEARSLGRHIPFDIVGAIADLLGDEVDHGRYPGAVDRHDRLTYAASAPTVAGYGDRPIVNLYVELLAGVLREQLGVIGRPRWPAGRVAAIALSHDVDDPDRYALLGSVLRPWRLRRHPRTYVRRAAELARARHHDRSPRSFWQFDELMESEARLGFRSTFFFATLPFHARSGAPEDVAYDIRSPAYRRTVRALRDAGFEIGLHASYRAHEDVSRLVSQRAVLGDVAGVPIAGLRHHYWRLGPDVATTLRAHEEAGFTYDSSLAFNDHVGFRRSVALPFHAFDEVLSRPLRTMELPTFCMDGNLFYGSEDVETAVRTVEALIDRIVATGGMGAIDWHIQTSFPANHEFHAWGEAYQTIIRRLAERRDVWVTDLGSIAAWVDRRRAASPAASPLPRPSDAGGT